MGVGSILQSGLEFEPSANCEAGLFSKTSQKKKTSSEAQSQVYPEVEITVKKSSWHFSPLGARFSNKSGLKC
jgi:hypothetical protein